MECLEAHCIEDKYHVGMVCPTSSVQYLPAPHPYALGKLPGPLDCHE